MTTSLPTAFASLMLTVPIRNQDIPERNLTRRFHFLSLIPRSLYRVDTVSKKAKRSEKANMISTLSMYLHFSVYTTIP